MLMCLRESVLCPGDRVGGSSECQKVLGAVAPLIMRGICSCCCSLLGFHLVQGTWGHRLQMPVYNAGGLLDQGGDLHAILGYDPLACLVSAGSGVGVLAPQEPALLQHQQTGARHVVAPGDVIPHIDLLDGPAMVDVEQDRRGVLLPQHLDSGQLFRFRSHGKGDRILLNVTFVSC